MTTHRPAHPDVIAARAFGVGVGLIATMLTWLVGNRLAAFFLDPPAGPVAAFTAAVAVGIVVGIVMGRRLVKGALRDLRQRG